jgi:hypothetical protein
MQDDERDAALKAALAMLDSFERTGANQYDLTITSAEGKKLRFRPNVFSADLRRTLPALLDESTHKGQNIILRPRGPGTQFIQLDDLDASATEKTEGSAFLTLETSPGNFQAWIALPESESNEDFTRRLRKGTGADPTASGATRIAGSYNFKPKHAPDFPLVRITSSNPGHITTRAQLEAAGLVAAPEPAAAPRPPAPRRSGSRRPGWPSYSKCVAGAPLNREQTGPDISRADFTFCLLALDWGQTQEATAARLMEESPKAKENGDKYAQLTAKEAAKAIEARSQNQR